MKFASFVEMDKNLQVGDLIRYRNDGIELIYKKEKYLEGLGLREKNRYYTIVISSSLRDTFTSNNFLEITKLNKKC